MQTAQLLMKHLQMPPCKGIVDRRLREQFFGSFLGLTFQDYRNYFSSKEEMYTYAVPGGEPGINVFRRGRDLLWDIAYRHSCETVVLVTHGLNCCQINKCLKGSYGEIPALGLPRLYDFNEDLQECDLTYALHDQIE